MDNYAWILGLRSIFQHLRRNLAAGLAIGFGYLAMLMIFGYSTRVGNYFAVSTIFLQQSGHISVFKKNGLRQRLIRPARYSLTPDDLAAIDASLKTQSAFDFSAPYMTGSGLIGNGCASFLFSGLAFHPEVEQRIHEHPAVRSVIQEFSNIDQGKELWKSPIRNQISVGVGLAKRLGKAPVEHSPDQLEEVMLDCSSPYWRSQLARDNHVQLLTRTYDKRLSAVDADVTASFRTGMAMSDEKMVQMPLLLMQDLFATDSISYLAVFLRDVNQAPIIANFLEKNLQEKGIEVDALVWNNVLLNPNYVNGMAVLDVSILFVSIVVIFVVLLSVINTLTIGLAESRREIGSLRAIGYKPHQVAFIFAVEAGLVALVSLAVGAVLSKILVELIAAQHIPFRLPGLTYPTSFQITPTLLDHFKCGILLFVLVVGTTLLKARSYAQQSILRLLDPGA